MFPARKLVFYMKTRTERRVSGALVGFILFCILGVSGFAGSSWLNIERVEANQKAWGPAIECRISPPTSGVTTSYNTDRREVTVHCPGFSETGMMDQEYSRQATTKVWVKQKPSGETEMFFADLYSTARFQGGGGLTNKEPPVGYDWFGWHFLLSLVLSALIGYCVYVAMTPENELPEPEE